MISSWLSSARTTIKYKPTAQVWDNGSDNFDRLNRVWRDLVKTIASYGQKLTLYSALGQAVGERRIAIGWSEDTMEDTKLRSETGQALKKRLRLQVLQEWSSAHHTSHVNLSLLSNSALSPNSH